MLAKGEAPDTAQMNAKAASLIEVVIISEGKGFLRYLGYDV